MYSIWVVQVKQYDFTANLCTRLYSLSQGSLQPTNRW
jgi:hypothetical protein